MSLELRLGFAAGFGFAAVATLRRNRPDYSGLCPGSGLALRIYWAKGRTKGIAQSEQAISTAGHSHRLTSVGKAETRVETTLGSK